MKVFRLITALIALTGAQAAISQEGLMTIESPHDAETTMDRAENIVTERGFNVFARIDHAAGAQSVDMSLRPTALLIFGNPQGGTPFMQCAQTVGIDLPVKFLVWEDAAGQVYLGYNDPAYIARRHGAADCPVVENMSAALAGMAEAAVAR